MLAQNKLAIRAICADQLASYVYKRKTSRLKVEKVMYTKEKKCKNLT